MSDWRDRAACRGADTEIFYPEPKPGPPTPSASEEALTYCARCPVTRECLSWATENNERHGIWGGQTPRQRSSIDAPAHGTIAGYWRHRRDRRRACQPCLDAISEYERARRARKKETA